MAQQPLPSPSSSQSTLLSCRSPPTKIQWDRPPPAPSVQLAAGARPCRDTTRQPITRAWSHCKPIEGAAHNQSELLPPSVIGRSPVPGGDQSYLTTTCCWYNNKMSARPTSVRARPVAPRDSPLMSAIFVCARRAVGKIFINFCRALDSKPLSSSTTLGKRPWLRAGHKGYWGALRPCPPSSNCSHQFCQNSNRFRRGCRNVLFSSLQF